MKLSEMTVEQLQKKLAQVQKALAKKSPAKGGLHYSEKLEKFINKYLDALDDLLEADSSCTTGYDNDGSTGFELFENGFELAENAAGRTVLYCNDDYGCFQFFIANPGEDEDAFIKRLEKAAKDAGLKAEGSADES